MAPRGTPPGSCDPASRGDAYNVTEMAVANGLVDIIARYGWDGVSTRETGCDGPFVNGTGAGNKWAIQVTNNDTVSWFVNTVGKRGQPRHLELLPGVVNQYTATQAANNGYQTISDLDTLSITQTPQ